MKRKTLQCSECEADFNIHHDMDSGHYKISYCPFCGDPLDPDVVDEGDELEYQDETEEEDYE